MKTTRAMTLAGAGGLLLAGVAFGGIVAGTLSASAADDTSTPSPTTSAPDGQQLDPSRSSHPGEELLTGSTAEKVRAAALAKYPNATIQRVETDSEGVYEAHIITAAGDPVTVQVGKDFTVTGTQTGGGPGDHRGPPPGQPDTSQGT